MAQRSTAVVPGVEVAERHITPSPDGSPIPVVTYERPGRRRPGGALVWIHGGGMVMGHPGVSHDWCSAVADTLGALVVSVDYRLAPEHPAPAGLHDCYDALRWVHDHAGELGVDPGRVAVGGPSAGGGLAAALCQLARDRGGPPVCFQLLNYPMLDDRSVLRDDHLGRGDFVWTPKSNRFAWTAYLGHHPRPEDAPAYAAPARTLDVSGLPPAWIGVGDLDLFYEEDVDYAGRLRAAGVPCELHLEEGMYHGADAMVPSAPRMTAYFKHMLDSLAEAIG